MCQQTIRLANGATLTGRLVDHLGNGLAEVDYQGKRFVGRKLELERRGRGR